MPCESECRPVCLQTETHPEHYRSLEVEILQGRAPSSPAEERELGFYSTSTLMRDLDKSIGGASWIWHLKVSSYFQVCSKHQARIESKSAEM